MVSLIDLWLPILLSAVAVFIASSIIHMVLKYHGNDFGRAPKEEELQDALRGFSIPAGDYVIPCPGGSAGMKDPKFQEMTKKGPIVLMTVIQGGAPNMGASLAQWFLFCLVVSVFAAYVTGRAIPAGAPYLSAFRFAGRFSCCPETVSTVKHHFTGAGEFSTGRMGNFQPELTPDAASVVNRHRRSLSRVNDTPRFRHRSYAFDTFAVVHKCSSL